MAEIICKETSCAFNEGHGCLKRIVTLEPGEIEVMKCIGECLGAFYKLDQQHPDELREFVDAVHAMQDVLALRAVRRSYPEGWPTYSYQPKDAKPEENLAVNSITIPVTMVIQTPEELTDRVSRKIMERMNAMRQF
jgi:hypothetical protein